VRFTGPGWRDILGWRRNHRTFMLPTTPSATLLLHLASQQVAAAHAGCEHMQQRTRGAKRLRTRTVSDMNSLGSKVNVSRNPLSSSTSESVAVVSRVFVDNTL